MIKIKCSKCGLENKETASFCKECGTPLNPNSNIQSQTKQISSNDSGTKKIIIICITVIICVALIGGGILYLVSNNNPNNSNVSYTENNTPETINQSVNTQNTTTTSDDVAVTDAKANSDNIKIINGYFETGHKLSDKTYCAVYVGESLEGTTLKIRVLYTRDGKTLNPGNIVPKTVTSDGYISLKSANAFKYYPDHASITLYDMDENILDTKEVEMSATSGSQSF